MRIQNMHRHEDEYYCFKRTIKPLLGDGGGVIIPIKAPLIYRAFLQGSSPHHPDFYDKQAL